MKTTELAAEIVAAKADTAERLDVLAAKVGEVIDEVARSSGISADEVLNALVRRQQEQQQRRGIARVRAEAAILKEYAARIATETERILTEESKG